MTSLDVQRILESFTEEFRDLTERQLFTSEEIRTILKIRTEHEYNLHRRIPLRNDFLKAISYELNLHSLKRLRNERMKKQQRVDAKKRKRNGEDQQKRTTRNNNNRPADYASLARATHLFDRALRKFSNDLTLWHQYIEFLVQIEGYRKLGTVLPRALLLHPKAASLWCTAADYERNVQHNDSAARTTLLRAIRINPTEHVLYWHLFSSEIQYIAKRMERRRLLGLNAIEQRVGDLDLRFRHDQSDERKVKKLKTGLEDVQNLDDATTTAEIEDQSEEVLTQALLPLSIYKNAIHSSPELKNSLSFRLHFLTFIPAPVNSYYQHPAKDLLLTYFYLHNFGEVPNDTSSIFSQFAHHETVRRKRVAEEIERRYQRPVDFKPLISQVYESIEEDFASDPEAICILSTYQRESFLQLESSESNTASNLSEAEMRGVEYFSNALHKSPSISLMDAFIAYCYQRAQVHHDANNLSLSHSLYTKIVKTLHKWKSSNPSAISEQSVKLYIQSMLALNLFSKIPASLELFTSKTFFPKSPSLWSLRTKVTLLLATRNPEMNDDDLDALKKPLGVFESALNYVSDASELYQEYIDAINSIYCASQADSHSTTMIQARDLLHELYQRACSVMDTSSDEIRCQYASFVMSEALLGNPIPYSSAVRNYLEKHSKSKIDCTTSISVARYTCDWLLSLIPFSVRLFNAVLEAESSVQLVSPAISRVRFLYQRAIDTATQSRYSEEYNRCADLWLDLIRFELQNNNAKEVNTCIARALKQLPIDHHVEFLQRHQELF